MNKLKHFLYFLILQYTVFCAAITEQAWVKVPVCDLIGDFYAAKDHNDLTNYYNNLPFASKHNRDCPRIHQLLFNEEVTIIEEKDKQCLVKIPSIYYELEKSSERFNTFWTLKENLITRKDLNILKISLTCFPEAINFQKASQNLPINNITLCLPFYDPITKMHYSVGTRFVLTPKQENNDLRTVYIFDKKKNKCITTSIPQKLCYQEKNNISLRRRIDNLVALLHLWIKQDGFIPYVWGGLSFTTSVCKNSTFELNQSHTGIHYVRSSYNELPKKGFDCAGLIARAAQISGLPYYFKNSMTIKKNLNLITDSNKIHEGDILWIKGHVMIVASLKNNTLIEARSYEDGYGKIHEITLSKVFQGIQNFKQLIDCYNAKKTLYRLNDKGIVTSQFKNFALLSLESAFV